MMNDQDLSKSANTCLTGAGVDLSNIDVIELAPEPSPDDYQAAMIIANVEASTRIDEAMLISWYDRDRDLESSQHSSECHLDSAIPGYVDYGLSHGATLMIDIENDRFVFFYMLIDL